MVGVAVLLMKGSRVEVRQGRKGGELAMQEQGKGQEQEQERLRLLLLVLLLLRCARERATTQARP